MNENNSKKFGEVWKSIADGSINAWEREIELLEKGFERMDDAFINGVRFAKYRLLIPKESRQ